MAEPSYSTLTTCGNQCDVKPQNRCGILDPKLSGCFYGTLGARNSIEVGRR